MATNCKWCGSSYEPESTKTGSRDFCTTACKERQNDRDRQFEILNQREARESSKRYAYEEREKERERENNGGSKSQGCLDKIGQVIGWGILLIFGLLALSEFLKGNL